MTDNPYLKCAALQAVFNSGDKRALDLAKATLEGEDVRPSKENRVEEEKVGRALTFSEVPAGSIKEVLRGPGMRVTMKVNDKDPSLVKEEEVDSTHAFAIGILFSMAKNRCQPAAEALKGALESEKDEAVKGLARRLHDQIEGDKKTFVGSEADARVAEITVMLQKPDEYKEMDVPFGLMISISNHLGPQFAYYVQNVNSVHLLAVLYLGMYAAEGNTYAMEALKEYAAGGETDKAKKFAVDVTMKFTPGNAPFTKTVREMEAEWQARRKK
jgi:hypothetical protein